MRKTGWKIFSSQRNCVIRICLKGHSEMAMIPMPNRKYMISNGGKILKAINFNKKINQTWVSNIHCKSCQFVKFNCAFCGAPLRAAGYTKTNSMAFSSLALFHDFSENGVCETFDALKESEIKCWQENPCTPERRETDPVSIAHDMANITEAATKWRFIK